MIESKQGPEWRNFIGGQWIAASDGSTMEVVEPAGGEVIAAVAKGTAVDVESAVAAAREAFPAWRDSTPRSRAEALFRLADVIDEHREELVALESRNVGKPQAVAAEEIAICSDSLRFLAGASRTMSAPAGGEYVDGFSSTLRREPHGVVGSIVPWNYPLMLAVWKFGPALATGNTVVLKPAEQTPLTMLRFLEHAEGVLPDGVLNVVTGYGEPVGRGIAAHPDVSVVSVTGSPRTGRRVYAEAADSLKQVHLELGGNAPVLVFADAQLPAVAEAVRTFGYWNSGQECGSATRILVERSAHDELLELLIDEVGAIRTGAPDEGEEIEMGPLISSDQRERVLGFVQRATAEGAQLAVGGVAPDRPGFFVAPTVVTAVEQSSEIVQSEVFGPVVTLQPFDDEDQALAWANDSHYGLCASAWTKNGPRALRLGRALDYGTVWINSHLVLASETPWGGFKQSGFGKDMSVLGLEAYTRVKHVMANLEG